MTTTNLLEIPATSQEYYMGMQNLRDAIISASSASPSLGMLAYQIQNASSKRAKRQKLHSLESAIDKLASQNVVKTLAELQARQAPELEELLIRNSIFRGIPLWMDGSNDPLLQYSIITEGRCLPCYNSNFELKGLKRQTQQIGQPLRLSEIQKKWNEIMLLDKFFDDPENRHKYTPRCKDHWEPTLLTSTVHRFSAVNPRGELQLPYLRFDFRVKGSGEAAFKHTQWLVGELKSDGTPKRVEDYLASRSIASEKEFPEKFVEFLSSYSNGTMIDWNGLIYAQCCGEMIDRIGAALSSKKLRGVYKSRIKDNVLREREAGNGPAAKFIEGMLPVLECTDNGLENLCQIDHHFVTEQWHTSTEGTMSTNHLSYAAMRLTRKLEEWSPLHWIVFRDIALPIFSQDYLYPFYREVAERALNGKTSLS
ncbi:hypothetical protein HYU11_02605 [Candidatus Woesearchaeota archaeon]|nr:hypothetical protein [Candidatus Woesearchaeota archaeon]